KPATGVYRRNIRCLASALVQQLLGKRDEWERQARSFRAARPKSAALCVRRVCIDRRYLRPRTGTQRIACRRQSELEGECARSNSPSLTTPPSPCLDCG